MKKLSFWAFSPFLAVLLTPVVPLELRLSSQIFKKFKMAIIRSSGAWGKIFNEKTRNKSLATLSL
jgi:hypothetical protein